MKILLISCLLFASPLIAQVFPVQVSIQLVPPYTPYLSDYTTPGAQNLYVRVQLNDLNVRDYRCKLRITIEGAGIALRTSDNHSFQPILLQGAGIPQFFYGADLHEYFSPSALEFSGLSPGEFAKTGRLPEGFYRFNVEVLDYNRNIVVSNRGSTAAWIVLNDPPMLSLPHNFSTVPIQDPPNILFTWTPRHTGSPNAAFSTLYTFRLLELWPGDRNPNDAFLTQVPLYETTTNMNQLLYGAAEPMLLPGRKYAWQVEAHDSEGKDLFRNDGRSEIFVFQYGEALPVPENLRMRWAKPTTLAIQWDPLKTTGDVRYRLQYRTRRRYEGRQWRETWTRFTDKTLYHLKTNTEYEMRIRSENAVQESDYSEIRVFKTLRENTDTLMCRDDAEPPPIPDNTIPVFPLSINDTIHAGGYKVLVRDVMKDGSRYYGSGLAIVPWLNNAKVKVTFEKITVNDRFWLTSGTIHTAWSGSSSSLIEKQSPPEPGHIPQAGELAVTVAAVDSLIIVEHASIAAVTKDEHGNIVITATDGTEQIVPKGNSVSIADGTGNGYIVDEKGNIAKTTSAEAEAAAHRGKRDYRIAVAFHNAGRFGFDRKKYEALSQYYQRLYDTTFVPWKALSSAAPDKLQVTVTSTDVTARKITFSAGDAQLIPVAADNRMLTLQLQGKLGGVEEELLALYSEADSIPPRVTGKVNLATYNPVSYTLEIIPVNNVHLPGGLDAETISQHLNTVYAQAVVTWNVRVRENLSIPLETPFNDGQKGVFSNYTDDMKKVLNAYRTFHENTYYLFVIDTPSDYETLGYMPRNRQAGFVFAGPHRGDARLFLKTIAHELGHGAFNLKHIFSEHAIPPGTTDNLMDYSEGTALYKYQWDRIHEPQQVIRLFGDDESGFYESGEDVISAWWHNLPPFKKAAEILQEHLTATKVYEDVRMSCSDSQCLIAADLKLTDDIIYTMEITLTHSMSADDLIRMLVFEYRVDLWNAFNIKAENVWDELYHWWRKQNDDLAQQRGWQVSALNLLADIVTAPTMVPAVEGWLTGKHWRDGHELSGWEQALSVLDFLAAEEMTKACITNMVVRVGGKAVKLLTFSPGVKTLLRKSIEKGLKIKVAAGNEILIITEKGELAGRVAKGVLTIPYSGFGGPIVCNPGKTVTVIGKYRDEISGGGISVIKENKLYEYGENLGGVNILDDPGWTWDINEKWLREAVARDDIIRVISDPRAAENLWKAGAFGVSKSPFGKEVAVLESLGYKFNDITFEFLR